MAGALRSSAELWWEQAIVKDRLRFVIGKMLPFTIYDFFYLKSPKMGYLSSVFNLNPTISWPMFGPGFAAGSRLTKETYIVGVHDAKGRPMTTGSFLMFILTLAQTKGNEAAPIVAVPSG